MRKLIISTILLTLLFSLVILINPGLGISDDCKTKCSKKSTKCQLECIYEPGSKKPKCYNKCYTVWGDCIKDCSN